MRSEDFNDPEFRLRVRAVVHHVESMRILDAEELAALDRMIAWFDWWEKFWIGAKMVSEWLVKVAAAVAIGFAAYHFVISKAAEVVKQEMEVISK